MIRVWAFAGSDSWDPKPSLSGTKGTSDTDVAQLDSDDDEDVWTEAAAAAKQKGNELYQRAEHQHAVQMYTVSYCSKSEASESKDTLSDAICRSLLLLDSYVYLSSCNNLHKSHICCCGTAWYCGCIVGVADADGHQPADSDSSTWQQF